jgi:hypothetical protein
MLNIKWFDPQKIHLIEVAATLLREGIVQFGPYGGRLVRLLKHEERFWVSILTDRGWDRLSRDFKQLDELEQWERERSYRPL